MILNGGREVKKREQEEGGGRGEWEKGAEGAGVSLPPWRLMEEVGGWDGLKAGREKHDKKRKEMMQLLQVHRSESKEERKKGRKAKGICKGEKWESEEKIKAGAVKDNREDWEVVGRLFKWCVCEPGCFRLFCLYDTNEPLRSNLISCNPTHHCLKWSIFRTNII